MTINVGLFVQESFSEHLGFSGGIVQGYVEMNHTGQQLQAYKC